MIFVARDFFALSYGQVVSFTPCSGTVSSAIKDADFAVTLQRGTEWAATGKVTQNASTNFPTEKGGAIAALRV